MGTKSMQVNIGFMEGVDIEGMLIYLVIGNMGIKTIPASRSSTVDIGINSPGAESMQCDYRKYRCLDRPWQA